MRAAVNGMQTVFIIAGDVRLRTGVRAELRERGVEALGMEMTRDMRAALARGLWPDVILLEDSARAADDSVLRRVGKRVPVVLVASRMTRQDFPFAAEVLSGPVSIDDIVKAVLRRLGWKDGGSGGPEALPARTAPRVGAESYATIPRMEAKKETPQEGAAHSGHGSAAGGPMIHRVCIQCNNMFSVPAGDFNTKQCPACHKG